MIIEVTDEQRARYLKLVSQARIASESDSNDAEIEALWAIVDFTDELFERRAPGVRE